LQILIYTHGFAPKIGGVETYVMLLAQGLAESVQAGKDGLRVTVATPTPAEGNDDAALPFRVVRQPGLGRLIGLIREADVVHLAGPSILPLTLSLALRKPTAVEHHGYQAICPNGLLLLEPDKTLCPGHFMARHYGKCIACNAAHQSWFTGLVKVFATFPRRWACRLASINLPISDHVNRRQQLPRSQVVYYGIPDPRPQPPVIDRGNANDAPPRMKTFAYVGRLVSEKGLPLLLEAAHYLRDGGHQFRLKFIGDGPERLRMEDLATTLDIRECVEFTGFLEGEALEKVMRTIDAVVMPSVWEETAGLSAIEQMMRGRLVVAADIGGLGEVVGEGGLKFPPGDIEGLASCLRRVLDEPDLAKALGKKARQRALQLFLEERMVAEHLSVYRQLLGGSGPSPEGPGAVGLPLGSSER
jgi:glycosyltransferase involved in cell wall biosynthesis